MTDDEVSSSIGATRFFDWLKTDATPKRASLAGLSREPLNDTRTSLTTRASAAWATPIADLTCGQVRLLTSQRMGLEWIGADIGRFVVRYPAAWVTFFPGDLSCAALRAIDEIQTYAPEQAQLICEIDFSWFVRDAAETNPSFAKDIEQALLAARERCGSTTGERRR